MFSDNSVSGWIGSCIFIIAQLYQTYHLCKQQKADDVSYPLLILIFIGNSMYTYFGYVDNSLSIFIGNLITTILIFVQLCQKYYYTKKLRSSVYSSNSSLNSYFVDIDEIRHSKYYND